MLQHVKKQPCPVWHRQSSSSPAPPGQGEITHKNRLTLFQVNSSSKIGYKSAKLGKQKSRLCTYGSAYEQENRSIVYNFLIHSTSFHCQFTETLKTSPIYRNQDNWNISSCIMKKQEFLGFAILHLL